MGKILMTVGLIIVVIMVYLNFRNISEKNKLESNYPTLRKGDEIRNINLISQDGLEINKSLLNKDSFMLLYVFKSPCSICNENLKIWDKMALIINNQSDIYGIQFSNATEMVNFSNSANLQFKLYIPDNIANFKNTFKINFNLAYTLLIHKKKVVFIKIGDIEYDDFNSILRIVKENN